MGLPQVAHAGDCRAILVKKEGATRSFEAPPPPPPPPVLSRSRALSRSLALSLSLALSHSRALSHSLPPLSSLLPVHLPLQALTHDHVAERSVCAEEADRVERVRAPPPPPALLAPRVLPCSAPLAQRLFCRRAGRRLERARQRAGGRARLADDARVWQLAAQSGCRQRLDAGGGQCAGDAAARPLHSSPHAIGTATPPRPAQVVTALPDVSVFARGPDDLAVVVASDGLFGEARCYLDTS